MDEYEQYLADIEYEDYLKNIQQEDAEKTVSRYADRPGLGADYNQGYMANAGKAVMDFPAATMGFIGDAYDFASSPIDTVRNAGAEKTAHTVGSLASGTAGAVTGAGIGAGIGSFIPGPGTVLGGIIGGGIGGGLGMMGFDVAADAGTAAVTQDPSQMRPYDQYLKDAVYNSTQGIVGGGLAEGAGAVVGRARGYISPQRAEMRATAKLTELDPSLTPEMIDQQMAAGMGDPLYQNRSLGELVGSDKLKNAQRTVSKSGIEQYGRTADRMRMRDDARFQFLDEIEPSMATVDEVQMAARDAIENKLASGQAGLSQAEDAARAAIDDLRPGIDPGEAGGMMREGAQGFKDNLIGQQREQFGKMGAGQVDVAPVAQLAEELKPQYFKEVGQQPDGALANLFEDLNRQGEATGLVDLDGNPTSSPARYTLQDIQAMRSKALEIANGGDRRSASVAGKIADALRDAGDMAVEAGTVAAEEAAAWQKGIALRKEQGTKTESTATPAKAVLARQPYGEYKLPESSIPSKYWRRGKDKGVAEGLRNYKETIGRTEQALEPLYRYATDSFRDYVIKDGKVNVSKYDKWINDHKAALDELPELRQQFSTASKAQQFVEQKFGDLQRTQADIEKGALKYFLEADPEVAIAKMLSGQDAIKRTKATADYLRRNDKDAVLGLRRGVIEYLQKKAYIPDGKVSLEAARSSEVFDGTVQRGVMKREWERIKPAIEKSEIFNSSQLKGFDQLYKDLSSEMSINNAVIKGGSDTAQNLSAMASLYKMGRTGFLRTVPGGKYLQMIEPILQAIPEARFLEAFEEALLNPLYARDLLTKASEKNVVRAAEMVFKREISAALANAPAATNNEEKRKAPIPAAKPPRQATITSTQSFPNPQRLMNPETRARVQVESSGNPYAVSKKGAEGLSQLMPETAKEIARELGEIYKPIRANMSPQEKQQSIEQNIRFGEHYFNKLMGRYRKNPNQRTLARAAYNAGMGRVDNALAASGNPNNVNAVLGALPSGVKKETIPYVNRMSQIMSKYQ